MVAPEIVTGIFALGGVLITGGLALWGYRIKTRAEVDAKLRTEHFERRLKLYSDILEMASDFYDTAGAVQPRLNDVRRFRRELALVGSPKVIAQFNAIFDHSADVLRSRGTSEAEIRRMQTETFKSLVNAIRTDLYPGQKPLDADQIRFASLKPPAPND